MAAAEAAPDDELARRVARLWPHREHEAAAACAILCRVGIHRWRRLDLSTLVPGREIRHCFWCSRVQIDGVLYDP
jgi:hypothetical protein